jgi:hypothetical protein
MPKIEGTCKEVMDKTEWVAIATCGDDGPHVVATWGAYVRAIGIKDDEVIIIPAGMYNKTEENLKKNNRVELLIASRQVQGTRGPGQGCSLTGKGEIQTSGELAEAVKKRFSWARGALVIKVERVKAQL